jgi:HK97 family phage prohead protease
MPEHMIVPVEWKTVSSGPGELDGYVSVFGNVDQGGDVVLPGAFRNTLRYWSKQAQPLPLIADHELSTGGVIGSVHDAREDGTGLRVRARFSSDAKAQSVRTKMIEGHVRGMSFTYEAVKHHLGTLAGKSVRYLQELKLFEATVTPFPMNTLAVGSAKAAMTSASINDLPDSAFAYIEPGGKVVDGRTEPRSKRHFPVHDEAHARNALAQAPKSPFGKQAMPKILAACRKFGIQVSQSSSLDLALLRDAMHKALEIPVAGGPDGPAVAPREGDKTHHPCCQQ